MMDYELYQDSTVPVFYHIPKNAGTFAISTMFLYFRKWRKNTGWVTEDTMRESARNIIVLNGKHQVARIIAGDPNEFCNNTKEFFKGDLPTDDETAYYIKLEDVNADLMSGLNVFSIIIESEGFQIHEDILSKFPKFNFKKFIILRDALERAKSFFRYITSDKAKHEPGHGTIPAGISISEFLSHASSGHLYEDSWVIRQFTNVQIGNKIRWYDFRKTKNILDDFDLCDISKCGEFIEKFYKKYKNIEITQEELGTWHGDITYNKREDNEDEYIDFEVLDKFNEVTHWDRLLYRKLLGRQKMIFRDGE
jgi:hypothetical protein